MKIFDLIRNSREDKNEFKRKLKDEQDSRRIKNILDEREKSSNQRELERYMKEKNEEHIKIETKEGVYRKIYLTGCK